MINSKRKGYRGEKIFRDKVFDYLGVKIRPAPIGSFGDDGKLDRFSLEIKNTKRIKFNEFVKQARSQSKNEDWLLAIKEQGKDNFTVTMDEKLFFLLIREEIK